MFEKYYNFTQNKLGTIGELGGNTTFNNYLNAVLGGIILILSLILAIAVIIGTFTVPLLLLHYCITHQLIKLKSQHTEDLISMKNYKSYPQCHTGSTNKNEIETIQDPKYPECTYKPTGLCFSYKDELDAFMNKHI